MVAVRPYTMVSGFPYSHGQHKTKRGVGETIGAGRYALSSQLSRDLLPLHTTSNGQVHLLPPR